MYYSNCSTYERAEKLQFLSTMLLELCMLFETTQDSGRWPYWLWKCLPDLVQEGRKDTENTLFWQLETRVEGNFMHSNNNIVQLGGMSHAQYTSLVMKDLPVSYSSFYIKI